MNIHNKEEREVCCVRNHPKDTFPPNLDNAVLEIGRIYHVAWVDVQAWHTDVCLVEHPDIVFGSTLFEEIGGDPDA